MPSLANTASKLEAYFESRSLIRNRKLLRIWLSAAMNSRSRRRRRGLPTWRLSTVS
jgi:hypothetical protein